MYTITIVYTIEMIIQTIKFMIYLSTREKKETRLFFKNLN